MKNKRINFFDDNIFGFVILKEQYNVWNINDVVISLDKFIIPDAILNSKKLLNELEFIFK